MANAKHASLVAHMRLALTDTDYEFLSDCAAYLTPEQIRRWCEALFIGIYGFHTRPEQAAELVIDLEFIKRNR